MVRTGIMYFDSTIFMNSFTLIVVAFIAAIFAPHTSQLNDFFLLVYTSIFLLDNYYFQILKSFLLQRIYLNNRDKFFIYSLFLLQFYCKDL